MRFLASYSVPNSTTSLTSCEPVVLTLLYLAGTRAPGRESQMEPGVG